jgi:uncharacterized membrane protein YdbT with pleckstrin-like domain
MSHPFPLQPEEHIVLMARKHWFVLLRDSVGLMFAAFLPLIAGSVLLTWADAPTQLFGLAGFASFVWMTLVAIALAHSTTSFYLDLWVVTNKRIVYIEQVRLFSRETTTVRIERIQDATVVYHNFVETMLNFGTLRIQSAGATADDLEVYGIPNPEEAKQRVLAEVDKQSRTDASLPPSYRLADEVSGT